MTHFIIDEDFPTSEIESDLRFFNPKSYYNYLFKHKWPNGFRCKKCGYSKYWLSSRNLYICSQCEHRHSLAAGTIMDGFNQQENPYGCVKLTASAATILTNLLNDFEKENQADINTICCQPREKVELGQCPFSGRCSCGC